MKYCQHCMSKIPDNMTSCENCHQSPIVQSPSHHLKGGTVLNQRYLVGEAIGEGGFGITYIGFDLSLELKVAVKEFYPHGYANRNNSVTNDVTLIYTKETDYFNNAREHFLREAKNIAKFSNEKAIVDVRDYFTENNTAYIVMEYIDGITLSASLKRYGVFESNDIFDRFTPLMQALNKMHRQDVIHRDISPDNIMITTDGNLKLMDFGSARYFAGENKRTMSVVLKPGYAPFEQYSSDGNQGRWTDVYALCATIYKCITQITPPDVMSRCQQDSLKTPSSLGLMLTMGQESVLMKGLRIYPADRWQSIDEMISALDMNVQQMGSDERTQLADGAEQTARLTYGDAYSRASAHQTIVPSKKRHTGLIVAVLLFACLLIIGGTKAFLLLRSASDKDQAAVQDEDSAKVTVPDVTGKKYTDAETELEELGLIVETTYEPSDSIAKDYVVRQSVQANRKLNHGETVMIYVSSGSETEEQAATAPQKTSSSQASYDVESEVEQIRSQYYDTQHDPGDMTEENGVQYYRKNGHVTKIVCSSGYNSWEYSRMYFYQDGELYFAFVFKGGEEHRMYFVDKTLIRYIDDTGTIMDYGSIECPFVSRVLTESNDLLQSAPSYSQTSSQQGSSQSYPRSTLYLIKIIPDVYVYESADPASAVVMTLDEENIYTIVEEVESDGVLWGRLKSGAGWLNINEVLQNGGYITGA